MITWFFLVAAIIAAGLILLPGLFGYDRYAIESGSMEPTIPIGSVVYSKPATAKALAEGDIITYRPPPESGVKALVTHRIVEKTKHRFAEGRDQYVFRTKGDANLDADPWTFTLDDDEAALEHAHIPYLGYVYLVLSIPAVRILLITVPALLIAVLTIVSLWREAGREAEEERRRLREGGPGTDEDQPQPHPKERLAAQLEGAHYEDPGMNRGVVALATLLAAVILGTVAAWAYFSDTKTSPQPISLANFGPNQNLVYKATGVAQTYTSSGTKDVSYPLGTQQKDLLLLIEVNSANQNITTPAGWTLLADQATGSPSQFRFTVWWKLAGAENAVAFRVNTNSSGASAWIVGYRQQTGADPVPATASVRQGLNGASVNMTPTPDVTTNANNASVISLVAIRAASDLSLLTPRSFNLQDTDRVAARNVALGIADAPVATSGTATPSPTWTLSGVPVQWAWATVAFK